MRRPPTIHPVIRLVIVLAAVALPLAGAHGAWAGHQPGQHGAATDAPAAAQRAPSAGPSRQDPAFEGLGDLPGGAFESLAQCVSADGSIVAGTSKTGAGSQAFRWTAAEGMTSLGNVASGSFKETWATGLSADGAIVVGDGAPDGADWTGHQGYRWSRRDGMVEVKGTRAVAAANADGSVIVGDDGTEAVRVVKGGSVVRLGLLAGRTFSRAIAVSADGRVVTGSSADLPSWSREEAYVWTEAGGMRGLGVLADGVGSFPNALSADGTAVAGTVATKSGSVAYRWTRAEGMTPIGQLPGTRVTHPGGITNGGAVIVGGSFVDRDHSVAFIWDAAHGMRRLQAVMEQERGLSLTGWVLESASAITPDGSVVVGWGRNPHGDREAFRARLRPSAR